MISNSLKLNFYAALLSKSNVNRGIYRNYWVIRAVFKSTLNNSNASVIVLNVVISIGSAQKYGIIVEIKKVLKNIDQSNHLILIVNLPEVAALKSQYLWLKKGFIIEWKLS